VVGHELSKLSRAEFEVKRTIKNTETGETKEVCERTSLHAEIRRLLPAHYKSDDDAKGHAHLWEYAPATSANELEVEVEEQEVESRDVGADIDHVFALGDAAQKVVAESVEEPIDLDTNNEDDDTVDIRDDDYSDAGSGAANSSTSITGAQDEPWCRVMWKSRPVFKQLQPRRMQEGKKGVGVGVDQACKLGKNGHRQTKFFAADLLGGMQAWLFAPQLLQLYGDTPSTKECADNLFNGKMIQVDSEAWVTRRATPNTGTCPYPSVLEAVSAYLCVFC
jgi:hypothetical protein